MKKDLHPNYNKKITITCACGNSFVAGSTVSDINVDICSKCHPFYTGEEKFVDTEGRVDKFKRKQKTAEAARIKNIKKIKEKIQRQQERTSAAKSLKEMIKSL